MKNLKGADLEFSKIHHPFCKGAAIACVAIMTMTSCAETESTNRETDVTESAVETESSQRDGYYITARTSPINVADDAYEISLPDLAHGEGNFWIANVSTGEGQEFTLTENESATFEGWTFSVFSFGSGSVFVEVTSPDGTIYPDSTS